MSSTPSLSGLDGLDGSRPPADEAARTLKDIGGRRRPGPARAALEQGQDQD